MTMLIVTNDVPDAAHLVIGALPRVTEPSSSCKSLVDSSEVLSLSLGLGPHRFLLLSATRPFAVCGLANA